MNLLPCKLSHRDTASSLETEEKSKAGSTKKLSGNMTGGRSVSPAELAKEDSALAIASTRSHVNITETIEHILLLDRESVQKTDSGPILAMPVDEADSEEMQLQHELKIIGNLGNPEAGPEERGANKRQEKSSLMVIVDGMKNFFTTGPDAAAPKKRYANKNQIQDMLKTIGEANTLRTSHKLAEADKKLEPIFEYVRKSGDCSAPSVVSTLCRSKAHILYIRKNVKDALTFFEKSNQFANPIIFPDRLHVLYIRAGMDEYKKVFHPGIFLEELREWLADDKKHQKGLSEFEEKVPQVRIFHDAIKAIFEEESADTKESRDLAAKKYKQSLARLAEHKRKGSLSTALYASDHMLRFARNLVLIKQGRLYDPEITSEKKAPDQMSHLDLYIYCHRLQKTGEINRAITLCRQIGIANNYPFLNYLEELEREEAVAE